MEHDIEHIEGSRLKKAVGVGRAVKGVINGDIFGSKQLIKHLPYLTFIVFLGLIYIA